MAMLNPVEKEMKQKIRQAHVIPYPIKEDGIIKNKKSKKVTITFCVKRNDPVKGGEIFINALTLLSKNIQSNITVELYGLVPNKHLKILPFIKNL